MKFRVYLGPLERVMTNIKGKTYVVEFGPRCDRPDCSDRIAIKISDRWCIRHALEYVKAWEAENAKT